MVQKVMVDRLILLIILVVMNTKVHCEGNVDEVNVTILESAVSKGAVCLDGSPPGYHYAKGFGNGADNWMVYLEGGGWCGTESECLTRTKEPHGSSKNYTTIKFEGILSQNCTTNPDFYNWNRVFVRYCDGGSFSGDVEAIDQENNIYRRGARIFRAVVDDVLAKGMRNSSKVMLVGQSAGGLATIWNCDRFRALLPDTSSVKCVSDSGFFLHAKDLPGAKGRASIFANVTTYHNTTQFLPTPCTSKMDPALCSFPENVVGDIQTPLFIQNSALDKIQIKFMLQPHPIDAPFWNNCTSYPVLCTPGQLQTIMDFRTTFLKTLQDIGDCPSRGLFINSCYMHDFVRYPTWNGNEPRLGNKTIAQAIGDWYFDRCSVKEIDIDHGYPLTCVSS